MISNRLEQCIFYSNVPPDSNNFDYVNKFLKPPIPLLHGVLYILVDPRMVHQLPSEPIQLHNLLLITF